MTYLCNCALLKFILLRIRINSNIIQIYDSNEILYAFFGIFQTNGLKR